MRRAFAHRGFRRLFAGLSASMLGDSLMLLVLSMWVKTLTGSSSMAGLTFFFMVLPALGAPFLGVLIDRVRRRPLLIWGNLASAAMVLPLVLVRDAGDVWLIWAVAVGYGVSFIVLPAGLNGLLKELLPDDQLVEANASLQTAKESFRLVGPLAGAALFAAVGGGAVALVNAATFVVAAVAVATVPVAEQPPARETAPLRDQLLSGARHLVADRPLKHLLAGFGLAMLVMGFGEAAFYALLDGFKRPPTFVAVLVAVMGVGAVAGGLLASPLVRRYGEVAVAALGLAASAVAALGIATAPTIGVVLGWMALFGVSNPLLLVAFLTLVQRRTPQRLVGRVSTAVEVVLATPQAISLALGSLLVVLVDWRVIFVVKAVVVAAATGHVVFWLRDLLRPGPGQASCGSRSSAVSGADDLSREGTTNR